MLKEPAIRDNIDRMKQVWAATVEQVKKEVISPALWRALERTVAIAWEDGWFVIGMSSGAEGHLASQLQTGDYHRAIERSLRGLTGDNDLRLRLIDGSTYADWEFSKAKDAAAASNRQQAAQKQYRAAAAFGSWDEVYDQVSRLWASLPLRSLSSGKARFLDQAFTLTLTAMETLMPDLDKVDEGAERGLSRVVERIASIAGAEASVVAYLLMERRRNR